MIPATQKNRPTANTNATTDIQLNNTLNNVFVNDRLLKAIAAVQRGDLMVKFIQKQYGKQ